MAHEPVRSLSYMPDIRMCACASQRRTPSTPYRSRANLRPIPRLPPTLVTVELRDRLLLLLTTHINTVSSSDQSCNVCNPLHSSVMGCCMPQRLASERSGFVSWVIHMLRSRLNAHVTECISYWKGIDVRIMTRHSVFGNS